MASGATQTVAWAAISTRSLRRQVSRFHVNSISRFQVSPRSLVTPTNSAMVPRVSQLFSTGLRNLEEAPSLQFLNGQEACMWLLLWQGQDQEQLSPVLGLLSWSKASKGLLTRLRLFLQLLITSERQLKSRMESSSFLIMTTRSSASNPM